MSMILKGTLQDLVELLENKAQESRDQIGKTRTKLESNELKGQVYAFNEAAYYVKAFIRGQEKSDAKSADTMENVDGVPSNSVGAAVSSSSK